MSLEVILVDPNDEPIGTMEKLEAHQKGLLHRAFSIFTFNSSMELLLQKRAEGKYHTPGLWTNTCCSHQSPLEDNLDYIEKRLDEEMGIKAFDYTKAFTFTYMAQLDNGLTEHELDHIYFSRSDEQPVPNPDEVSDWKYQDIKLILTDIERAPENYTPWFKLLIKPVAEYLDRNPALFNK